MGFPAEKTEEAEKERKLFHSFLIIKNEALCHGLTIPDTVLFLHKKMSEWSISLRKANEIRKNKPFRGGKYPDKTLQNDKKQPVRRKELKLTGIVLTNTSRNCISVQAG